MMDILYSVLKYPSVSLKCEKLKQSIGFFHVKDLHQFLPHLLSNIFGFDQTVGWGLRWLSSTHPDFAHVYSFLSPNGDLFKLLTTLERKKFLYEFPLAMLPAALHKKELTDASHILLSAYDYFFYHFSCFLPLKQSSQCNAGVCMQDSLYAGLFQAYMSFYLPCHGTIPISDCTLDHGEKPSWFGSGSQSDLGYASSVSQSECFVEIFIASWITQHQNEDDAFHVSQTLFKPSDETLLCLRKFIKHIHFFVNGISSSLQFCEAVHMTDNLRRSIIATYVRKRLFLFLDGCLKYCTCDGGYRYVVELWLTYIQPWRYTDPNLPRNERENVDPSSKWNYFIVENFPFYSALFVNFLGRCQSLDLTTYIHAILLYRVAKVFSRQNLNRTLKYAESLVINKTPSQVEHFSDGALSFSADFIRASLMECCGSDYYYTPVFHQKRVQEVQRLLSKVVWSKEMVISSHSTAPNVRDISESFLAEPSSRSFLDKLTNYFSADDLKEDHTYMQNIVPILDGILMYLLQVYELPESSLYELDNGSDTSFPLMQDRSTDTWLSADDSKEIKLLDQPSKLTIEYRGDPFTQPLRSYENAALVRMLCRLSAYINEMWLFDITANGCGSIARRCLGLVLTMPHGNRGSARINLRPLASYYNFLLLVIVMFLTSFLGLSHITTLFLVLLTVLYCIIFGT